MKNTLENVESYLVRNGFKLFNNAHTFKRDKCLFYQNRVEDEHGKMPHIIVKAYETGEIIIYKEDFKNF